MGKLGSEELSRLLKCIGRDPRVIIPPQVGFDSGVHLIDDKYLVVSTDPCIDVPREWFGWLLVNYAASDVALFGAKPEFCSINLLGPPSTKPQTFQQIMKQTCHAADDLRMTIVTGHTGTYNGLSTPVGVCTAYGTIDRNKLITPNGAKPGDYVFCLKPLGLEVAVNFALSRKPLAERIFGAEKTQKLKRLVSMQSCVREALLLAETCGVHAMHDATEGGLTATLNEIAEASKVGFRIDFERILISDEVQKLRGSFRLSERQLLSMSSTGTILAAIGPEAIEEAEAMMRQNKIQANVLGIFTEDTRRILTRDSKDTSFPKEADDPYARILSGKL
ncbi:MAG TPA: AIR synthase-related protein [candidate division Zixibacteria bacterium]|nr:AIR synthase-related protein [candidate division Zixibacteria bacterium]